MKTPDDMATTYVTTPDDMATTYVTTRRHESSSR
jgi:hypothetical protein